MKSKLIVAVAAVAALLMAVIYIFVDIPAGRAGNSWTNNKWDDGSVLNP
jgi:hypothetical protein